MAGDSRMAGVFRSLAAAGLILALHTGSATAQSFCQREGIRLTDPAAFSRSLIDSLTRLEGAIPALSPRELDWLDGELRSSSFDRHLRALESREYVVREARRNVGALIGILRNARSSRDWMLFSYTMLEIDSAHHLARLVTENVIPISVLPIGWRHAVDPGARFDILHSAISGGRGFTVQSILACTLPGMIGQPPLVQ
jgi:hypothetical protein